MDRNVNYTMLQRCQELRAAIVAEQLSCRLAALSHRIIHDGLTGAEIRREWKRVMWRALIMRTALAMAVGDKHIA